MLNLVALEGRLTAEPELRHTNNDIAVTSFSLAVQRNRKNADGKYDSDFFNIVAWRGTAEMAAKYFSKGSLCVVEGELQQRRYTDKEGNKRTAVEVVARSIHFAGSKGDGEGNHSGGAASSGGSSGQSASSSGNDKVSVGSGMDNGDFIEIAGDDDLPF